MNNLYYATENDICIISCLELYWEEKIAEECKSEPMDIGHGGHMPFGPRQLWKEGPGGVQHGP